MLCDRWSESPGSSSTWACPLGWCHMYFNSSQGRQQGLYFTDSLSIAAQQYLDGQDDAGEQNMEGRRNRGLSARL